MAIEGRQDGLSQIWVIETDPDIDLGIDSNNLRRLSWPDELYKCEIDINKDFDTKFLRIKYSSFMLEEIALQTPRYSVFSLKRNRRPFFKSCLTVEK